MPEPDLGRLRRHPDVEAENLFAYDAADLLLLEHTAAAVDHAGAARTVVVGDNYGALTIPTLLRTGGPLRVAQDPLSGELALAANAQRYGVSGGASNHQPGPELLANAQVVLLRLPRSLSALEELCWHIATHADPEVTVYAAGRVKHMTLAMNAVLARYFDSVSASRASRKSRILTATGRRVPGPPPFPVREHHDVGLPEPLTLCSYGAAFGGGRMDPGTRLLLPHLRGARAARTAVDLGCGTGTIAAFLALLRPELEVTATDQSASAVASSAATAEANNVADRVHTIRDDALSSQPERSRELIVLNPPFHIGSSVHTGIALKLFADAARVLEPGGELWTVWNSHLAYAPALRRIIGATRQVDRNPKFTVSCSTRSGEAEK